MDRTINRVTGEVIIVVGAETFMGSRIARALAQRGRGLVTVTKPGRGGSLQIDPGSADAVASLCRHAEVHPGQWTPS
jgi:NAD(P)-dependent dehydrogenase (short-subunit alcohol dehydrogenase family)